MEASCTFSVGVARDQVYLPFIPLGITYGVNEISLPDSDGGTSNAIVIPIDFPFGDSNPDQFYVISTYLSPTGSYYIYLHAGWYKWTVVIRHCLQNFSKPTIS